MAFVDNTHLPVLTMMIGRRRAKPAHCPVCGLSTAPGPPKPGPVTLSDLLSAYYNASWHLYKQAIWYGHSKWFFTCYHMGSMQRAIIEQERHGNPFLDMIKKGGDNKGWFYKPIPLMLGKP